MSHSNQNHTEFILGIDLGTTTVKVALVDARTKQTVRSKSRETKADIHSDQGCLGNEQDAARIVTALQFCLSGLPKENLLRVVKIGISGQMHGVMLWKSGQAWTQNQFGRFDVAEASQLFTWQDRRCTTEFIQSLPKPHSHLKLASGLGCSTIMWLKTHDPDFLKDYDCAGTIQDFVVSALCGLDAPVMSVHNAASWGYYDTVEKSWNKNILQELDFPVSLLPEVYDPSHIAGHTQTCWYGIPENTPVGVAMGDLQCSILSRLQEASDAVLNISTSAQLAFQMHQSFTPPHLDQTSSIEYFPYFHRRYLAVAASLTGGNVMASLVRMIQQWTHEFGMGVPEGKIWEKLHALGEEGSGEEETSDDDLIVIPTLFGERHTPDQRASVSNITPHNTGLRCVHKALCRGIVTNLHDMMSQDCLLAAGVNRIVGSGTVLTRSSLIRQEILRQYMLPLELGQDSGADAAVGSALAMLH